MTNTQNVPISAKNHNIMYYSPFINIYMLVINMMWLIFHKFFDDSFYSCDCINGFHESSVALQRFS